MENQVEIFKRAISYIKDGKTEMALMHLTQDDTLSISTKKEIIPLLNRFNRLKLDLNKGLISRDYYDIEINKITNSILSIENQYIQAQSRSDLKKYRYLLFLLLLLLLVAVYFAFSKNNNPINRVVSSSNYSNDVDLIIARNDLNEKEIEYLRYLETYVNGRSSYVDEYDSLEDYVVDSIDFKEIVAEVFLYLEENGIKYSDLLSEKRKEFEIRELNKDSLDHYRSTIDSICQEGKLEFEFLQDSINNLVDVKFKDVFSIDDEVNLDFKIINKTSTPIVAIDLLVSFQDKYGNEIKSILFNYDGNIIHSSTTASYVFPKETKSEIFNIFHRRGEESFLIDYDVVKINHGGGVFPPGDMRLDVILNKFNLAEHGYCFFLDEDEPIVVKNKSLVENMNDDIRSYTPVNERINNRLRRVLVVE